MWARPVHAVLASAGLVTVLVACTPDAGPVGTPTEDERAPGPGDEDPDFGEPEVEDTRTEEPAGETTDQVALQLPGLPIGGSATVVSDALQCASVNWSGPPDIPAGMQVEVTQITLEPAGVYAPSKETCTDTGPSCLPILWSSGEEPCTVAIAWTGEASSGEGRLLVTAGRVVCTSASVEACTRFRDEVAGRPAEGIPLEPPPPGTTGEEPTGDDASGGAIDVDGTADGVDEADG